MPLSNLGQVQATQSAHLMGHPAGVHDVGVGSPPTNSPLVRMGYAIENTQQAVIRLESIADQLCGTVPQAVPSETKALAGGGIFGAVAISADQLYSYAVRAQAALDRIAEHLP